MGKKLWMALNLVLIAAFMLSACAQPTAAPQPTPVPQPTAVAATIPVGIVLPTKDEPRWIQDETRFKDALSKAGYEAQILFSQGDSAKEKANVEALISQGIKVLIICPQDGTAAAAAADEARKAGVKVISYDRLVRDTDAVDYYVTFDSVAVGAAWGDYLASKASGKGNNLYLYAGASSDNNAFLFFQGAWSKLQPKIADGTFVIKNSSEAVALQGKAELTRDEEAKIIGQVSTNWDFNTAKNLAESNLTTAAAADKGTVFIAAPNDGTARAIADAFAADKDVKTYYVTGQDAEKASVQYIIDGKQSMTVLKDVRTLVADAITAAVAYLKGGTPEKTNTYNNGKVDVPAKPSAIVTVTKDNVQAALIDSGYYQASDFTGLSAGAAAASTAGMVVGLSFSDFATERWKGEKDLMEKLLTEKGYKVVWQEANHDVKLQNDQIDNMVTQGAKALIIIAEDGDAAATAVDKAAAAGVKVIAYDRLIKSANIAAYISFNNTEVGRQEALGVVKALGMDSGKWTKDNPAKVMLMGGSPTDNNAHLVRAGQQEVIKPYVDAGTMKIVADQWVDNWDPANALKIMENVLTAQNNKIDGVIASNDGTALGALQALKAQGLAGKVPISGQDATADGCNSIVKGEQTVSVYKDTRLLSPMAVDMADKLLKGQAIDGLKAYAMADLTGDKTKTGDVQCNFLTVQQVTKDNVFDLIVKSGFQSYDDVYRDIPDAQRPPKPGAAAASTAGMVVGLSFSDFATERWKGEKDLMEKLLTEKGYKVVWQEANHDVKLQNDQIDNMVTQGAKALIIIAEDGDAAATAVDKAAAAGVKVIAYDRLIKSANIAAYISFNNTEVGRQEALGVVKALGMDSGKWTKDNPAKVMLMGGSPTDNNAHLVRAGQQEVIKPYVDAGTMKIVADQWVDNWDPANALKIMENVLTAQNNKIDGVIASNDGTALGALQALKAQGLAGKVPISGQDATADGCNSIVKGEQTVSVYKDTRLLSPMAVDMADKLLKGQAIDGLKAYAMADLTGDKTKTGDVQCNFLTVQQVTKDNVFDLIVKSGFQSYDDVYRDIPDAQRPPKP